MKVSRKLLMIPDVYWVGAVDWAVRDFHGYNTDEGSSYNCYLVLDQHPTLIDTVKAPFAEELMERLAEIIDPLKVEYIIMNHAENDHTGALPHVARQLKNAKIVTNKLCAEHLQLLYPSLDPNQFQVQTAPLSIGKYSFIFVPVPLLHWPDSMFSYCPEMKTLFANDGFGQHIASSERWVDEMVAGHVIQQMREYTANILGPFQHQMALALKVAGTITIENILTAHGCSWRGASIGLGVNEYVKFATNTHLQDKLTIVFYSVNGSLFKMATTLAQSTKRKVAFIDLSATNLTKCALHAYDSKYLAFGSPNFRDGMCPEVETAIHYLRGLKLINGRKVFLFTSFCWSEKVIERMQEHVQHAGGEVIGSFSCKLGNNEGFEDAIKVIDAAPKEQSAKSEQQAE